MPASEALRSVAWSRAFLSRRLLCKTCALTSSASTKVVRVEVRRPERDAGPGSGRRRAGQRRRARSSVPIGTRPPSFERDERRRRARARTQSSTTPSLRGVSASVASAAQLWVVMGCMAATAHECRVGGCARREAPNSPPARVIGPRASARIAAAPLQEVLYLCRARYLAHSAPRALCPSPPPAANGHRGARIAYRAAAPDGSFV